MNIEVEFINENNKGKERVTKININQNGNTIEFK